MTIGAPAPRIEGRAKVTGAAKYAGDVHLPGLLHAIAVGAPCAKGRLVAIDAEAALAIPSVVRVLTAADMPRFGAVEPPAAVTRLWLQDDRIRHEGEPVALILAETIEAAEEARGLVQVTVAPEAPRLPGHGDYEPPPEPRMMGDDEMRGDVEAALAAGVAQVSAYFEQPSRHHNAMETSGTLAAWENGAVTLWDAVQAGGTVPPVVAAALGLEPGQVRVIAPHTGGGFGAKGYIWPHQILAAAAARLMGRPVRLHLRRQDQYALVGYQPWMGHAIRVAADANGRLTAMDLDAVNLSATEDTHFEPSTEPAKTLYPIGALRTRQRLERANVNVPTPMRAPVDGCGLWPIESALDELAERLGIDPLDLRLANYAERDPASGKPWSSNRLREAYAEAAAAFGWRERGAAPKVDGPWWIGRGMATCTMGSFRMPSVVRIRLRDGQAIVETNTHDIGTGTQTIFCQIAADELGIDLGQVSILWGDTRLPAAGPVYGSSATTGTGSAVALAARALRAKLGKLSNAGDPFEAMREASLDEIEAEGAFSLPDDAPFSGDGSGTPYAMRTWGAIFVEVGVDPDLGVLRLRRAVGRYSAGRIINSRTARHQMTGAFIWGWGKATMEESAFEPVHGRWLAKNLSNVAIPVNADIRNLDMDFVDEHDPHASVIGARGIGELGATGVDAAVAAAVHDAIGLRFRSLPITPPRIIAALEGADG